MAYTRMYSSSGSGSTTPDIELQANIDAAIARNVQASDQAFDRSLSQTERAYAALNRQLLDAAAAAAEQLAPGILEKIQGIAGTALDRASALASRFESDIMPNLTGAIQQVSEQMMSDVSSRLRGELPADLEAKIRRNAAEMSMQAGTFGQSAGNRTARDLGLTSLDIMNQGHQLAGQAANFAPQAYAAINQILQAPVQAGIQVNQMLEPWRTPTLDIGGVFGSVMQANARAGVQSADAIASGVRSSWQFNKQFEQDNRYAAENAAMQRQAVNMMKRANNTDSTTNRLKVPVLSAQPWNRGQVTGFKYA